MTKWHAVINKKTGEPVSFGTEVANPLASELESVELDHKPQPDEMWDSKQRKIIKSEPSPFKLKTDRLRELRNKGWNNLSPEEKKEVRVLVFDIEGGPAPDA